MSDRWTRLESGKLIFSYTLLDKEILLNIRTFLIIFFYHISFEYFLCLFKCAAVEALASMHTFKPVQKEYKLTRDQA